jgi:hypothetical protein
MSALRSLVIVHSGGTRTLELYRVRSRTRSFAITAERARGAGAGTRVIGDRLENPSTLDVDVYLEEPTLSQSYGLAYVIIDECESATSVEYHEGEQLVDGITRAGVAPDGLGVRLSLSFAPTKAALESP